MSNYSLTDQAIEDINESNRSGGVKKKKNHPQNQAIKLSSF